MARASEGQLDEVRRRTRRTNPDRPDFISGAAVQALLDGEVFRDDGSPLGGRIGTGRFIEAMIRAGCHAATNGGKGLSPRKYKALWPSVVSQPAEYAGRLNSVLAVDLTLAIPALVACGNTYIWVDPASRDDLIQPPTHPDTGAPLTRYIAFCQLGTVHLGHPAEQCRREFEARGDEVGLVSREGLHLPIQHERHLRQSAVDLPGSRDSEGCAPCVSWFDGAQPGFRGGVGVRFRVSYYGSASRGIQVVPVSW